MSNARAGRRHLGPARVLEVNEANVIVELETGEVARAIWSVPFPYRPRRHDRVVVISRQDAHYAIGVLHGRGGAELTSRGRLRLYAAGGRLELRGDRGVRLLGPVLRLIARDEIVRTAECVSLHAARLERRVREEVVLAARDLDEAARERWLVFAHRVVLKARDAVSMNGKTLRVG